MHIGPNAVRILRTLGVLDDVLEKCNESELSTRMFRFVSGMEGHEVLYDVRHALVLRTICS